MMLGQSHNERQAVNLQLGCPALSSSQSTCIPTAPNQQSISRSFIYSTVNKILILATTYSAAVCICSCQRLQSGDMAPVPDGCPSAAQCACVGACCYCCSNINTSDMNIIQASQVSSSKLVYMGVCLLELRKKDGKQHLIPRLLWWRYRRCRATMNFKAKLKDG